MSFSLGLPAEVQKVFDYVDRNSSRFVEDLRELIRQPSVSAQNRGVKECAQLLKEKMLEAGIATEIIPTEGGHPIVFGEVKSESSAKTILFYGHYDVQPPDPEEAWQSPPFGAEMKDGKIYGRGASDMKSGVMAVIKATESYLKASGGLPINVKFIFEGEEEIGSPHLEQFVKNNVELLRANARVGLEGPAFNVELGYKGWLGVELELKEDRPDFHSRESVILVSPVWRLVWALSTLKDRSEKVTIDGFYDDVKDPTPDDLALLEQLQFNTEDICSGRLLDGLGTKEKLLARRFLSSTCNINCIVSGYTGVGMKMVVPSEATAKIDFILVPDQDPEDIFEKLVRHLEVNGFSDIKATKCAGLWPCKSSLGEKIAQVAIRSTEMVFGRKPPILPIHPGGDPSHVFVKHLNLPFAYTGANTTSKANHATNEYVKPEDYVAGIKKYAAIMYNFCT
jgi:acetylornithine deacetylase/succinyl-diaminopimelate desuccinylase-like protein